MSQIQITLYGGAGEVGGSRILLERIGSAPGPEGVPYSVDLILDIAGERTRFLFPVLTDR